MRKHLITLLALLALASHAHAIGNGRYGINDSGPQPNPGGRHAFNVVTTDGYQVPQWRGWGGNKRGLGGDPVPCCAEDPGQQPRK